VAIVILIVPVLSVKITRFEPDLLSCKPGGKLNMKPLPASMVIEPDVEVVGEELAVDVGLVVDVEPPVVPPHATSSDARSRLHRASGVHREMCCNCMSMIHFLLIIYIFASAPRLLLMESRWITRIVTPYHYTYLRMNSHP